jgi:glycine betaine/proline transport system substrate-binding protein
VQEKAVQPFIDAKQIDKLDPPNLSGAKATLAMPSYEYDAGLKTFQDIAKHKDELDGKIYGIEPGSSANAQIQKMIDTNQYGLGGFKLVQSSEAGMLVTVDRAVRDKKWVVFLGWEPHPMNIQIKMNYLSGGDAVFGPNYGEARVYTLTNPDFLARCPNAGKLVSNLRFTTQLENQLMIPVMAKVRPADAAKDYLKKNPQVLDAWLAGVKTVDGKDGLPAVKQYLGL